MNDALKNAAREQRVYLWEIADRIGVSEPTLFRWLRHPLGEEREKLLFSAISKIVEDRGGMHGN